MNMYEHHCYTAIMKRIAALIVVPLSSLPARALLVLRLCRMTNFAREASMYDLHIHQKQGKSGIISIDHNSLFYSHETTEIWCGEDHIYKYGKIFLLQKEWLERLATALTILI